MRRPESKIMVLEQAIGWRQNLREAKHRLVVTNGCFDLLHRGHVEYLARSREFGDALLVAINSDTSISSIKGPTRPVVPEMDRAYLLASLECVDAVVVFSTAKATRILAALAPDIYVKGGDYNEDTIDREEYSVLKTIECTLKFVPFVAGFSTTELIRKMCKIET